MMNRSAILPLILDNCALNPDCVRNSRAMARAPRLTRR